MPLTKVTSSLINTISASQIVATGATAGQVLTYNGSTSTWVASSTPAGTSFTAFESSPLAVPALDTTLSAAHGLGGMPRIYSVSFKCISPELGYQVDDEVDMTTVWSMPGFGSAISWKTNNVVAFRYTLANVYFTRRDGSNHLPITNAKWNIIFRAYR